MTVWQLPSLPGKNPYGDLLVRSLEARGVTIVAVPYRHVFALRALTQRPDVIHFQFIAPWVLPAENPHSWWRALVKGTGFLAQVALLRLAGCAIVWTVHNLVNHERRLANLEWFFSLLFTRLAHRVIVHSQYARGEVLREYRLHRREDRIAVVFHPNYIGAYPDRVTRDHARERLGIDGASVVIACLGQIRRYKGLLELVHAFRTIGDRQGASLWIAGEPVDTTLATELQREAGAAPAVHLRSEFLSADDVDTLLKAADVVALPYRNILTSGAAVLAMSYGKACVAPRLGCLVEVLDARGAFFYDPADPAGLRDALDRAIASAGELPAMGESNRTRVSAWSWTKAADLLIDVYESARGSRGQPAAVSGSD